MLIFYNEYQNPREIYSLWTITLLLLGKGKGLDPCRMCGGGRDIIFTAFMKKSTNPTMLIPNNRTRLQLGETGHQYSLYFAGNSLEIS